MTSLTRGMILSITAGLVGLITLLFPPAGLTNAHENATTFWHFLTYIWFGLAAILAVAYAISAGSRLGVNLPLALALLLGATVSLQTAALARKTDGLTPMLASYTWLLLFAIIGLIELSKRPRHTAP